MKETGVLTKDTFWLITRRYARTRKASEAIDTFGKMGRYGFEMELSDFNILLDALSKARKVAKAQELDEGYREMKVEGFEPDAVTYGIVMNAHCRAGKCDEAISLFREMEAKKCKPSPNIFCILITGLGNEKRLQEAVRILDEMRKCGVGPNSRTYDIIIHHLIKIGKPKTAYKFFQEMSSDEVCEPTLSTLCHEDKLDEACKYFQEMLNLGIRPPGPLFSNLKGSLFDEGRKDTLVHLYRQIEKLRSAAPVR
ncbi:hypothetical protein Tsubulata_024244 [Turnera subulata]|uniref:PROP1-like PPR domain-containing protein n=1 Tax=Turnera subulata TaxID=218843 RepID=A0A9Q0FDJ4_9ROSI|nr:hypothetical protein Tsubulata_024244 [Turnera subulata]